ncbi:unnamed protein product [Discosporangium mesarthrocarpum]
MADQRGYIRTDSNGKEVYEDKDRGLPVEGFHPLKPRKAIDMEAESSHSLSILWSVLGEGGGEGGEDARSRLGKSTVSVKKEGDKGKKEPTHTNGGGEESPQSPSSIASEAPAGNNGHGNVEVQRRAVERAKRKPQQVLAGDVERRGGPGGGQGAAGTRACREGSAGGSPAPGLGEDKRGQEEGTRGPGGDHGQGEDRRFVGVSKAQATFGSRKTPNRQGEEALAQLSKHHARPRELSRHGAIKPLMSAPSSHLFAISNRGEEGFSGFGLPPQLLSRLRAMGLSRPTLCQAAAIPVLSGGHNAVVKSETGSGKTLAYLLPLLCDLATVEPRAEREQGTLSIVLAPTRELSAQILEVLTQVARPFIWLVPGSVSGGERKKSEKARLRKGISVLVATPGRLLDHLKTTRCFRRDRLRWLVLDEADRLLDMGFEKQIKEIVELLDRSARAVREVGGSRMTPASRVIRRQTVMVSATVTKGVSRLSAGLLGSHLRVDADRQNVESVDDDGVAQLLASAGSTPPSMVPSATAKIGGTEEAKPVEGAADVFNTPRQLVQHYTLVTQKLRLPALCCFLRAQAGKKVVVFMSTCDAVDYHYALFASAQWPGDKAEDEAGAGAEGSAGLGGIGGKNVRKRPVGQTNAEDGKFGAPFLMGGGEGGMVHRLHGNVPQAERRATHCAFGASASGVLVCTDVAARGLDLPTVDWIVQYDPPSETSDYVHRCGRTARRGLSGHSLLFLLPGEAGYLGVLEGRGLKPQPLSLEAILRSADGGNRGERQADEQLAFELQQNLQALVAGDKGLLGKARAAFQSHVRAYAAKAPDSHAIFQVRSLHLGHVARSFALKDPPTAVKIGHKVVRRQGGGKGRGEGGGAPAKGGKRRRDGAGGAGGGVHRLGLSKKVERFSRAEFL